MLKNVETGWQITEYSLPDESGHFGIYGGRFVAETLMGPLSELEKAYDQLIKDKSFIENLRSDLSLFVGRPTPLYFAERLTAQPNIPNEDGKPGKIIAYCKPVRKN